MTDQEKLFALMAHADDLQTHAQKMQEEARQTIKGIPGEVRAAVGAEVHTLMEKETKTAKTALQEAATALAQNADELERLKKWPLCTMLIAVFLFAGALLGISFFWLERGRALIAEQTAQLEMLQTQIMEAEDSLAELKEKGAGISVITSEGKTWITLPKGKRFGEFGQTTDGRKAVYVTK